MISVMETINNLLELISTSPAEQELLAEIINIVGSYISGAEHTIFCLETKGLKIAATTLADTAQDDRSFLEKLVRNHYAQEQDLSSMRTTDVRDGIEKMYAYPLKFGGSVIGTWIIEYYALPPKRTNHEKAIMMAVGIALGSYMITKTAKWNLYLDPVTKLPGKYYFSLILDGIVKRAGEGMLCIIQPTKLEVDYQQRNKQMTSLCLKLNNLQVGMSYKIGEEIFSVITFADRVKVFDKMCAFLEENEVLGIRGTLIPICGSNDFFRRLDEILSHCNPGQFGSGAKKPYQKPQMHIKEKSTEDFDILQMLQEEL